MTLNEAIEKYRKLAEHHRKNITDYPLSNMEIYRNNQNKRAAEEYDQTASWLEELNNGRE